MSGVYFTNLFKESKLEDDKINFLMERLKLDDKIVPPGAKGAIRGNRFNQIIKDELTNRDKLISLQVKEIQNEKKKTSLKLISISVKKNLQT